MTVCADSHLNAVKEIDRLLNAVVFEAQASAQWTGRPRLATRVLAALRAVPRDAFVPQGLKAFLISEKVQRRRQRLMI